ncbi:MAG TPA: hypothetical protein VJI73_02105 [Candidatus Paceibacterota bacterium]
MPPDKAKEKKQEKKLEWQALEHAYYEKTSDWYWIVGVVGVTASLLAFLFSNAILGLLLLVGTITVLIHGGRIPGVVKVELQERGVRIGSAFYPYSNLTAFSLNEEHDPLILVLDCKAFLTPDIRIFIEEVAVEDIRDFLLDHLDEKYHEPSLAEGLIHYLGF